MSPDALRATRNSTAFAFVVFGAFVATWVSRIPLIREKLDLSDLELSVALLGSPLGLVLVARSVPPLTARFGGPALTRAALVLSAIALVPLGLAPGLPTLAVALLVNGAVMGAFDVAMNTGAAAYEHAAGRSVMSGMHATYSLSVFAFAAVGALATELGVSPAAHFTAVAVIAVALTPAATRSLIDGEDEPVSEDADAPALTFFSQPLLLVLGGIAFGAYLAEGAVADWSGVHLHDAQGASLAFAALGVSVSNGAMAAGRLAGDRLIDRFGHLDVLRAASLVAAVGMAIAVASPSAVPALAGYLVLGLGLATIIPIVIALASRAPGLPAVWALSRLTTCGYAGLLTGPAIVGGLASATSLGLSLGLVVVLLVGVAVLSGLAARRQAPA